MYKPVFLLKVMHNVDMSEFYFLFVSVSGYIVCLYKKLLNEYFKPNKIDIYNNYNSESKKNGINQNSHLYGKRRHLFIVAVMSKVVLFIHL